MSEQKRADYQDNSTPTVRRQAVELIDSARSPRLLPSGAGMFHEDKATADREAQLALAAAMVYLGDIIAASDSDDGPGTDLRRHRPN